MVQPILLSSKEAYAGSNPNHTSVLYVGADFDWVITAVSQIDMNGFLFTEIFPTDNPGCPFTYYGTNQVYENGTLIAQDIDLTNPVSLCLMEGITEIRMQFKACDQAPYGKPEFTWTNCIQYEQDGCFSTKDTGPPGTSGTVCDTVRVVVGCPVALGDGYCMEEEDLEAGDPIDSWMSFKKKFLDVTTFGGRLVYDTEIFENVVLSLNTSMPSGFDLSVVDDGYGVITFDVSSSIPGQDVNLGPTGIRTPVWIDATLVDDLTQCTNFWVVDFELFTEEAGGSFYVDPGRFCGDFGSDDPDYQEAWILVDSESGYCYDGSSMELTASGPFDDGHENTTYSWNTFPVQTTQSINVTAPGTYTVNINDERNCDREATIVIESCGEDCSCGDLNPVISMDYVGDCEMDFDVTIANCLNLSSITYTWTMPDGSTFIGEDPPLFPYNSAFGLIAKVKVDYTLAGPSPTGYTCVESDSYTIYPCNTLGKSGDVVISPNPGKDIVTISIEDQNLNSGTIKIMDVLGNAVISSSFNVSTLRSFPCDVSTLKTGVYFVQIQDAKTGSITTKRMIIE